MGRARSKGHTGQDCSPTHWLVLFRLAGAAWSPARHARTCTSSRKPSRHSLRCDLPVLGPRPPRACPWGSRGIPGVRQHYPGASPHLQASTLVHLRTRRGLSTRCTPFTPPRALPGTDPHAKRRVQAWGRPADPCPLGPACASCHRCSRARAWAVPRSPAPPLGLQPSARALE